MDDTAIDGDFTNGRLVLVESDIPLESGLKSHDRSEEESDDAVVGDDETRVLFFPWPTGDRNRKEVGAKNA